MIKITRLFHVHICNVKICQAYSVTPLWAHFSVRVLLNVPYYFSYKSLVDRGEIIPRIFIWKYYPIPDIRHSFSLGGRRGRGGGIMR
jgi:hypothetical protein